MAQFITLANFLVFAAMRNAPGLYESFGFKDARPAFIAFILFQQVVAPMDEVRTLCYVGLLHFRLDVRQHLTKCSICSLLAALPSHILQQCASYVQQCLGIVCCSDCPLRPDQPVAHVHGLYETGWAVSFSWMSLCLLLPCVLQQSWSSNIWALCTTSDVTAAAGDRFPNQPC